MAKKTSKKDSKAAFGKSPKMKDKDKSSKSGKDKDAKPPKKKR